VSQTGRLYSWERGPLQPAFPADQVDIWRVRLEEPVKATFAGSVLSADELRRGARYHFDKDRLHFARCRSALRLLLSRYLGIPGAELAFEYQSGGKPQLAARQNPLDLQFNVSHSAGLALIAVTAGTRLGIDIERIRGDVEVSTLTERFFSMRERDAIRELPAIFRVSAFFACWTRKESFLKATGDGLSFPLTDFSVSTHPDCDAKLEEIHGNTDAAKLWFLADLNVAEGYRATVALERCNPRLETYDWS